MKDILDQVRTANSTGLYYIALFASLALPDICGALESQDGLANQKKYEAWFDQNVAPKYSFRGAPTLTGRDAYLFRCSMLHQGRLVHPNSSYSRLLFLEPDGSGKIFHNNIVGDALNVDVQIFVEDVVRAAEGWLKTVEGTPVFQQNYASFVQRYPHGLAPYIVGPPVIG